MVEMLALFFSFFRIELLAITQRVLLHHSESLQKMSCLGPVPPKQSLAVKKVCNEIDGRNQTDGINRLQ